MGEEAAYNVYNARGRYPVVLVCEHASDFIPVQYRNLGLDGRARVSHIAWDPGALTTARFLADQLDAVLVEGTVSRLVYDLNRPPESPTAVPQQSEAYTVPGNQGLTPAEHQLRVEHYYQPFKDALEKTLQSHHCEPVLVTVHSFTPVYNGKVREVELGILHDTDQRLADAILQLAGGYNIQRNQPYGPEDGVFHTLQLHGVTNQIHNVMLEIRNDLLTDEQGCQKIASKIAAWLNDALKMLSYLARLRKACRRF